MSLLPHLQCRPDQIAERWCCAATRPGSTASPVSSTGVTCWASTGVSPDQRPLPGLPVTVCSTGIGGASAVIALEELVQAGARALIRVGSAGALQHEIALGISSWWRSGAQRRRLAGLPAPEYPACADIRLQAALLAHLGASGQPHWHGLVRSHDSFYRDDEQESAATGTPVACSGPTWRPPPCSPWGACARCGGRRALQRGGLRAGRKRGERLRSQRSRHDDRRAAGHRRRPPRPDAIDWVCRGRSGPGKR